MTVTYVIEGGRVRTLEDFWRVIGEAVNGPGGYFGGNLDALNDCLRGGYVPDGVTDYDFEWRDHQISRRNLGHPETARQLALRLARCHPDNRAHVRRELEEAQAGRGPTVFDWLVEIFELHGPDMLRLR